MQLICIKQIILFPSIVIHKFDSFKIVFFYVPTFSTIIQARLDVSNLHCVNDFTVNQPIERTRTTNKYILRALYAFIRVVCGAVGCIVKINDHYFEKEYTIMNLIVHFYFISVLFID